MIQNVKTQTQEFMDFIRQQGVVGLAVGFILGRAISDLVGSIVNDLINPIIGIFLGRFSDLSELVLNILGAEIAYGKFLSILINLIIVAIIVYFGIKKLGLEKLDKPKQ